MLKYICCVNILLLAFFFFDLQLKGKAGEACKQKLLNLDRLQIVEGAFGFIDDLWKRAKCNSKLKIFPSTLNCVYRLSY